MSLYIIGQYLQLGQLNLKQLWVAGYLKKKTIISFSLRENLK